jgi:type I restriction enzyme, S subunit
VAYKQVRIGDYFKFEKGLGYKGEFLTEKSDVALIGMDSHDEGGGYKDGSEKPYSGAYKEINVAHPGDVIFAATDLTQDGRVLGSPLLVPESDEFQTYIYSHHLLKAFQKKEGFLPEFLYNLYRVEKFRRKAAYADSGTTVRALPAEVLEEQVVPLPDLPIQQAINDIIAMIDQQIANNKALSKSLETLGQAMFKSWFIDFDPVHSKSKGDKPFGMDDAIATLFPSSFEKSEIGDIPKGWEVVRFSDVINLISGGTPKTTQFEYWNGDIPWYSVTDAPREGLCFFTKTSKYITIQGLEKSAARLIRPGITIISARGTVGKLAMAAVPSTFNQSCYAVEGKVSDSYTYFQLKSQVFIMQNVAHGGTFDTITRETFDFLKVTNPTVEILQRYDELTNPMLSRIKNLNFQNDSLNLLLRNLLENYIQLEVALPRELIAS